MPVNICSSWRGAMVRGDRGPNCICAWFLFLHLPTRSNSPSEKAQPPRPAHAGRGGLWASASESQGDPFLVSFCFLHHPGSHPQFHLQFRSFKYLPLSHPGAPGEWKGGDGGRALGNQVGMGRRDKGGDREASPISALIGTPPQGALDLLLC